MTKPARHRSKMSEEDRKTTNDWFGDTKRRAQTLIDDLDQLIRNSPAGQQKTLLEGELVRLRATRTMIERREEAFVATDSSQVMRPPSAADIRETNRLATRMAEAIAQQKKAEAIAELIDGLSVIASRITKLSDKS